MIHLLRKSLYAIAALMLAAMVASLFLQVVAREFHWSVDWTEESARFTFISMVFVAAVYSTVTDSHLRVSIVSDLLEKVLGKRIVQSFHAIVLIGFSGVMSWYSWQNFIEGLQYPNISPAIGFNQNLLFIFMTVGFAINLLVLTRQFVAVLRDREVPGHE